MAAFNILVSGDDATVTLRVRGAFDLSVGFAFWQYCQPEVHRRRTYVFDLEEVNDLQDSGLGWLQSFLRQARRYGQRVDLIRARAEVVQRLRAAGIDSIERSS